MKKLYNDDADVNCDHEINKNINIKKNITIRVWVLRFYFLKRFALQFFSMCIVRYVN